MRPRHLILIAFVIAASGGETRAAPMPSFWPHLLSWDATHVVVTEGAVIDGTVEVLESWLGDLKTGDKLIVPGLAQFAPPARRLASKDWLPKSVSAPFHVSGMRMVLYLVKDQLGNESTWKPAARYSPYAHAPQGYKFNPFSKPVDQDYLDYLMTVSVAWVEGDKVFAVIQYGNPGLHVLVPRGPT